MSTRKIRINTSPGANTFATFSERIIEYSSPVGGGLISFRLTDDGYLVVDLYREDEKVLITTDNRHKTNSRPIRRDDE